MYNNKAYIYAIQNETKKTKKTISAETEDIINSNKTNNIAYENNKKEEPPEKSKKDKVKNNKKKSKQTWNGKMESICCIL